MNYKRFGKLVGLKLHHIIIADWFEWVVIITGALIGLSYKEWGYLNITLYTITTLFAIISIFSLAVYKKIMYKVSKAADKLVQKREILNILTLRQLEDFVNAYIISIAALSGLLMYNGMINVFILTSALVVLFLYSTSGIKRIITQGESQ